MDAVDGLLRGVRLRLCALIDSGRLQDVYFYMSAVAAVNVGLFYLVKCGRHGAEVRGGLTRAVLAAERVRRVAEAPARGTDENPSAAGAGGREQPRGGRRRRREGTTSRGPSVP